MGVTARHVVRFNVTRTWREHPEPTRFWSITYFFVLFLFN